MTRAISITGGRVLTNDTLHPVAIRVEAGRIAALDTGAEAGDLILDATGLTVLPAIVDIHGDAFERQVMPRPDVCFPLDVALLDTDRQLAASGIATAYHALTLSWEPGLRSVAQAERFIDALGALEPRLQVENRIQLRWETFAFDARPLMSRVMAGGLTPTLAFNDHTTMSLRPIGMPVTARPLVLAETVALDDPGLVERVATSARRAGMSAADYIGLTAEVWARRDEVDPGIDAVAAEALARGVPMLSHDDSVPEMRERFRRIGARIAEFPMCAEVARAARSLGEEVVLGAPNVVRGGSHIGSLDAATMIEDGVCTILASDYYYPAMLSAVGRLVAEGRVGLATAWATVSANPARACGLEDRGRIEAGARADLVLVDWPEGGTPSVCATISAGRIAYLNARAVG